MKVWNDQKIHDDLVDRVHMVVLKSAYFSISDCTERVCLMHSVLFWRM
jgi:hypothetical protein